MEVPNCAAYIKGSIFLKNSHFIIKKRFNKLINRINTIIKCGPWQPVKFQLVSRSQNEMTFYLISELVLPTLIQRYYKKSFHFWSSSKTRDLKFYRLSDATFYDRINTIYQGPVVQSIVSLTSSLRAISLTILSDSIYNCLKFFAEKMWVAFALQKLLTFFQQKISAYLRIIRCKF